MANKTNGHIDMIQYETNSSIDKPYWEPPAIEIEPSGCEVSFDLILVQEIAYIH